MVLSLTTGMIDTLWGRVSDVQRGARVRLLCRDDCASFLDLLLRAVALSSVVPMEDIEIGVHGGGIVKSWRGSVRKTTGIWLSDGRVVVSRWYAPVRQRLIHYVRAIRYDDISVEAIRAAGMVGRGRYWFLEGVGKSERPIPLNDVPRMTRSPQQPAARRPPFELY